ncbi:alpha-1,4-N-acetylglucosaminyltransferase-like isoform X2 [Xenopus laevis]|nr:alpha-1,4-N-acetylglucosaminyltransferase-like isoform X2 [Xenopus laevis]
MKSLIRVIFIFIILVGFGLFYKVHLTLFSNHQNEPAIQPFFIPNIKAPNNEAPNNEATREIRPEEILHQGNGIFFIETTDRMEPPHVVMCAVESAARIYPTRPIAFFMKGLPKINTVEDENKAKIKFPSFSSYDNIYLFPLKLEEIFSNTPLLPWYKKVNTNNENDWTKVSSDASRLALIWKYGGIYMDTDIISVRPIPLKNFVAAESNDIYSNSVFGSLPHHSFTSKGMEDFVQNYNGAILGHQGPDLFARILKKFFCALPGFKYTEDVRCGNITLTNPDRFYPIAGPSWKKFYEVLDEYRPFPSSYALHLFDHANQGQYNLVPGSKTMVDHLYRQYCPYTYVTVLLKNRSSH